MRPWFCGRVHESVDITQTQTSSAKLQSCIHVKTLALAASYGILFTVMTQKMQMDHACTYTCIFEHISSCSIAHTSTNHQSTNVGVLKLLTDKNQLLIKTQTLVIVPTYSLTNPQKFLNTAFFLNYSGAHFERIHKNVFYRMWGVSLKTS